MTEPHRAATSSIQEVPRRALVTVMLVLLLWTSNIIWVRQAGDDIVAFSAWRMILALPVLGLIAFSTRGNGTEAPSAQRRAPTRATTIAIIGVGALFGISAFVNFVSLNETTLVNVGVIHSLQPAVVAVLAGRLLGEVVDAKLVGRATVAIAGAFLVALGSTGQGTWSLTGDLLAVLGLLLNSAWFLAGRWVRTHTNLNATNYMVIVFATAAATMTVIALASGSSLMVPASILGFALLTAVGGTVGHTMMAWAHRYVPASISSLFLLSQPVLVAILAWVAFGESLSPIQVVGGAIVLAALAGIVTRSMAEPSPEAPGVLPDARDEEVPSEES